MPVYHGLSKTPEYNIYYGMLSRCYNESHKWFMRYGGRGITVCERWKDSFLAFYQDMGPRPSPKHDIERVNNDGNYEPGNCIWADAITQNNNTRSNRWITHDGKTMTLSQWSRAIGKSICTIRARIAYGFSMSEVMSSERLPPRNATKRAEQKKRREKKERVYKPKATHCPHGHEFTPQNTYVVKRASGKTGQKCRECAIKQMREYDNKRGRVSHQRKQGA